MKICKVPGESDIADPLTKQLARPKFDSHVRSFGLGFCMIGTSASGRLLV